MRDFIWRLHTQSLSDQSIMLGSRETLAATLPVTEIGEPFYVQIEDVHERGVRWNVN